MFASLTLGSVNKKTGPIPVSTTSAESCADACPFKSEGCYGLTGPLGLHWRKVTDGLRGFEWGEFIRHVAFMPKGTLWRHNQAGDLPGTGDEIDVRKTSQLVRANRRKRGFTFSHKPVLGDSEVAVRNRAAIAAANRDGFTVNLSANTLEEADRLVALNIGPVAVIQDAKEGSRHDTVTPAGHEVATCPATYRDGFTCWLCDGLCQRQDRRVIVGFPIHGTQRDKATKIVRRLAGVG